MSNEKPRPTHPGGAFVWRFAAIVLGVLALFAAAASATRNANTPPTGIIPIALGDVVKVTGAPVGCIVRIQDGERALDCRRTEAQVGSYGTILTPTQVLVVRFESRKTARIVFQARHEKLRVHTCGG
jgi:2-hydroxychromene-2-carboxylate isomerase